MKFSIRISSRENVQQIIQCAKIADENKLWSFWVSNDLFKRSSWIILTALAGKTDSIKIGTAVVNPYTENPAEIAMKAATLDDYSDGRFLLGLGSGSKRWNSLVGKKQQHPLKATEEAIHLIRLLLDGKSAPFSGTVFKDWTDGAYLRFHPPSRKIPIYIGGSGRRMCELIGRIADGGIPSVAPPEIAPTVLENIKHGATKAAKDFDKLDIAIGVWGTISENERESRLNAKREIAQYWQPLHPTSLDYLGIKASEIEKIISIRESPDRTDLKSAIDSVDDRLIRLAITGTPDEWIKRVSHLEGLGVKHLAIWLRQSDLENGIRLLAKNVISSFN